MPGANKLQIIVNATDRASPVLHGVSGAASSLGSIGKAAFVGIGMAAAATVASITAVGVGLTKLAIAAAPLQGIQAAFEGLTGGGDEMLAALRQQSAHMITDRELMLSYNQAAQLVSKQFADTLPSAMRYLTKISTATGDSMDYLMTSLVRGVGRLSGPILDNLYIQVSLEEATAAAAEMFGKEADELSKAEIQAGMTNLVMAKLAANTADMPEVAGSATAGIASLRTAFANARDTIGTAFLPALNSVLLLFTELRPMFEEAVNWVADLVRSWAGGFAQLVADAAMWGANLVESFAAGISGSGAISRALRNVAATITSWLAPGSAPRLLPDLADWGAGAFDAWLSGWTPDVVAASGLAQSIRGNLRPFLEAIDVGEGIDTLALGDVFGIDAPHMRRYLTAYETVGHAVTELQDAREGLQKAEESGDEETIAAARERLQIAEDEEYSAKRAFNAEERRLEQRISAEAQIARAITETAKVQADAAANAAQLAEEAKQRAIAQAYLQYRLAVAGTPLAQIPIWEEELAKAEENSADWWNIQTRLVELRRTAAEKTGSGLGAAVADGYTEGLVEGSEAATEEIEKIDWKGIGEAIAENLWGGLLDFLASIPDQLTEWSADLLTWTEGPGRVEFRKVGAAAAGIVIDGLKTLFGEPENLLTSIEALKSTLASVVADLHLSFLNIGASIAGGIVEGIAKEFLSDQAAEVIGDAVEKALINAVKYVGPLGVLRLLGLGRERAEEVGTRAGKWFWDTEAGEWVERQADAVEGAVGAVSDALGGLLDTLDEALTEPGNGLSVGRIGEAYADGGIVTRPTWALIGERGPEAVIPLDRMGNEYNIIIPIDARGANAAEVQRGVLAGLRAAGIPIAP